MTDHTPTIAPGTLPGRARAPGRPTRVARRLAERLWAAGPNRQRPDEQATPHGRPAPDAFDQPLPHDALHRLHEAEARPQRRSSDKLREANPSDGPRPPAENTPLRPFDGADPRSQRQRRLRFGCFDGFDRLPGVRQRRAIAASGAASPARRQRLFAGDAAARRRSGLRGPRRCDHELRVPLGATSPGALRRATAAMCTGRVMRAARGERERAAGRRRERRAQRQRGGQRPDVTRLARSSRAVNTP